MPKKNARRNPPASAVFDIAPAPPQRADARSSMFPSGLTHPAALRRTCLDDQLMARAIPSSWVKNDDPADPANLHLCNVKVRIPSLFDDDPVCKAFEKELDRIEAKFRAGRKDKTIGGELGSIIVKKKSSKAKKMSAFHRRSMGDPASFLASNSNHRGANKRQSNYALPGERGSKRSRSAFDYSDEEPEDWTLAYRTAVKTEVVKAAKARTARVSSNTRMAKGIASGCVREARKRVLRSMRTADEAHRRARRVLRDVLGYWKKEDKERQEERKKLIARAEEQRKLDAEEREAQRQRNKLKFLLGQSESFSTFLQAKDRATVKVASQNAGGMDSITGTENEDELTQISMQHAAELAAAHKARIQKFDDETALRKNAADESAAKKAANREMVRNAFQNLNGITEEERNLMTSDLMQKPDDEIKPKEKEEPKEVEKIPVKDGDDRVITPVRQPTILNCKMKDYQLRGLAWLVSLYDQGINGILADEMGLGKTLQTISLLAYLCEQEDNWGPFLVVSPKATLHNWQQEVTKFCPLLKVLPYWGSKADRTELRKYWSHKRMYRKDSEFQVCITSYETLTTDERYFGRVKWQYMVLDEAQAIKNSSSSRWRSLLDFPCRNRLLLTGTPLQNKLSELWSLLHFIMPTVFDSHAEFADWFAKDIEGHAKNNKILDATTLSRLRTLLDPFMLRRVKRDVESEMPPKTEVLVHCSLSGRQRKLYAKVKANVSITDLVQSVGPNSAEADRNSKLMNIVMQLRKVCNHPELFERRDFEAPYQFQQKPPPHHVPHPPSILATGSGPPPPLTVTLLTRSTLVQKVPRATKEIWDSLQGTSESLRLKYGIWNRKAIKESILESGISGLAVLRLCGGLSVSDIAQITSEDYSVWNWERRRSVVEEHLRRVYDLYQYDGKGDPKSVDSVTRRPHRLLLQPRARFLQQQCSPVILPWHRSPAEIIQKNCHLLKSVRAFVPRAAAPAPQLYMPGDISNDERFSGPMSNLLYPEMPVAGSVYSTKEVYSSWRNLFGNYGSLVGTAPILQPDKGRTVADSGKMQVLDPLLKKLRAEGHKVLIYSQFTKVLDILEDYCANNHLTHVRIDGQSALADRRDIVADWQSNEKLFVFLLSTRAGGVGLNLTAADTVIFFDSDWNPTQDLQAMDRAHRLGQERPVTVYRLISPGTIEERMLVRAQQKSRINDLVIKGGGLNTNADEPKDNEITDIAALLMVEEEFTNLVEPEAALKTARSAVHIAGRIANDGWDSVMVADVDKSPVAVPNGAANGNSLSEDVEMNDGPVRSPSSGACAAVETNGHLVLDDDVTVREDIVMSDAKGSKPLKSAGTEDRGSKSSAPPPVKPVA